MKKIIAKHGTGKTSELIIYASENNINTIACKNENIPHNIERALHLGISNIHFIPYEMLSTIEAEKVLVDDIEKMLSTLFDGKIAGFVMSID